MTEPSQAASLTGINSGPGTFYQGHNQNIFHGPVLEPRPVPQDIRDAASEAFASVDHVEDARKVLKASTPLLIIIGDPHTGRRTAALHLLEKTPPPRRFSDPAASRMVADLDVDWPGPDVRLIPIPTQSDYLLDLSDEDQTLPSKFAEGLVGMCDRLSASGSRLVVLATDTVWSDPAGFATGMLVRLGRPNARDVADRQVRWLTTDEDRRRRVNESPIKDVLGAVTRPADAAALASAAAHIEDKEKFGDEVERVASWPSYLDEHFGKQREAGASDAEAESRILLISSAVADGHSTALVYALHDALRTEVGVDRDPWKALTDPGLTAQLRKLGASVTADQVRLTQARPGVDVAILRHVWREYPSIRSNILTWLGTIVGQPGWSSSSVQRVAFLVAAVSSIADVKTVLARVDKWSTSTMGKQQALATEVLRATLADEDARSEVLAVLRTWATSSNAAQQRTVAEVCATERTTIKPQRALVRLKWILNQPADDGAARAAGRALRVLAHESGTPQDVLEAVTSWSQQWPTAAARGFLHLVASPDDLAFTAELLSQAHTAGDLRIVLQSGWTQAWATPEIRTEAAAGLQTWSDAIDRGQFDQVAEAILVNALTDQLRATQSITSLLPSDGHLGSGSAQYRIVERVVSTIMRGDVGAPEGQAREASVTTDHAPGQR